MGKGNGNGPVNPYDPEELKKGLAQAPLVPMDYVGPMWRTTCSALGANIVDFFHERFGIQTMVSCRVIPEINRRDGVVTDIRCDASFDASTTVTDDSGKSVSAEIWLNGSGNTGTRTILQYKQQRTASGKFGTNDLFKKTFGQLAMEYDDDDNIIIREAPAEMVKKDHRLANYAFLALDFFAIMNIVLGITSNSPFDFNVDFNHSQRQIDGHEDCKMIITKFVGKKKNRNFKYSNVDPNIVIESIDAVFGNGNGGRRYR